ncbi:MAG TPA: TIGR04086 family membrane protein [Firmicutes bacterium]|nr:TIGR04086 family membrane protein [Bacillota bacterium]
MGRRSAASVQSQPPATIVVIIKGVLCAYLISLVLFLIFSALIQYTSLTEAILPYTVYATSLVAIFTGAAYVTARLQVKGWLYGGVTGIIYLAGLVVLALIILPDFSLDTGYVAKTALAFLAGAAGGIFGINM